MSGRLDIYPEYRLVVGRLQGAIDYQDVIAWMDDARCNETFSREYDGVMDLRGAILKYARPDKARFLAAYVIDENFTTGRWAILANRPKETALSFIYSSIAAGHHPIEIFSTLSAASDYLGRDLRLVLPE